MACAFTDETYFSEGVSISGIQINNVIATLSGAFVLQNFKQNANDGYDISLLSSYPFSFTCVGLLKAGESLQQAGGDLLLGNELGLRSSRFEQVIQELAPQVAPVTGLGASMQFRHIEIGSKAQRFVKTLFGGNSQGFNQWIAGTAGAQLAKQIGIPIIPYVENTSSRKLACVFEDSRAYQIALPLPVYYIDINLAGFSKSLLEENVAEQLWLYGAYATVTITDRVTQKIVWKQKLQEGVPKKIAFLQTVVNHEVAELNALQKLLEQLPQLLMEDRSFRPVIDACLK